MKNIIRKILKEEEGNKVVKNYITKVWKKQQDSGVIPMIDYYDLQKRNLHKHINQINNWYFDFVGNEEEAFKLFKTFIEGRTITDNDLRDFGMNIHPDDNYEVKINKVYNPDYNGKRIVGTNDELEFGYTLVAGQFTTSQGILTLEELYSDEYDDVWADVTNYLTDEIQNYVLDVSEFNFGLKFKEVTAYLN
jgi:hypothetical protein